MAYSNYGALAWKNGVDITNTSCDQVYYYKDNKWNLLQENEIIDYTKYKHVRFTRNH